ncbi:hypothetical protein ABT354_20380 [Streptomyces sp. NPDC000594]|uniref:hypothetical protein n=1 Tax=Streptomyces sp. NPDC000594 TaxID=3154261 RepID=UPI0033247BC7
MARTPVPHASGHRTTTAIYLVGSHTGHAVQMAHSLLITMPSARVRIKHPQALYAALTGWLDAEKLAHDTFAPGIAAHSAPPPTESETSVQVQFHGPVPGPQVDTRPPAVSLSGAGEVRVQVGPLSITTGDRPAFQDQLRLWTGAYRLGTTLWAELPAIEQLPGLTTAGPQPVRHLALAPAA